MAPGGACRVVAAGIGAPADTADAEALATVNGGEVPFDAFAAAPQRKQQLEAWRKWAQDNKGRATTRPVTELRVPGIRPNPTSRPATSAADFL